MARHQPSEQTVGEISNWWYALLAIGVGGTPIALLVAWASQAGVVCENECGEGLMVAQYWAAIVGAFVVAVAVFWAIRGHTRRMRFMLIVAVPIFAAWALLNDATTHGWSSDMVLVP